MSVILRFGLFGVLGFLVGAVLSFASALVWASALPAPSDGTFAMRQMLACLPIGAVAGLMTGIAWALR